MYLVLAGADKGGLFGQQAYLSAANIATEALASIRTVASFGGEVEAARKYEEKLGQSSAAAITEGARAGLANGMLFGAMFLMYGLGLWYGSVQIAASREIAIGASPFPYPLSIRWEGELSDAADLADSPGERSYVTIAQLYCDGKAAYFGDGAYTGAAMELCACGITQATWDWMTAEMNVSYHASPECGCSHRDLVDEATGREGCKSGGSVLMVFFSIMIGAFAMGQVVPALQAIRKAREAAARMYTTIDRTPGIDPSVGGTRVEGGLRGEIEFRGVHFSYQDGTKVFEGIDIHVMPGETVAIVGESGCGKSTLAKLVMRFYDAKPPPSSPVSGAGGGGSGGGGGGGGRGVFLDGVPIRDLDLVWARSEMGIVSQEPLLFDASILDNIRNGRPEATDEEVRQAAREANAHDFVTAFPDGYETVVGARGGKMSGGQKQRIAIARAILRNPTILVLDEATSALDSESERIVQKALDKLMSGGGGGGEGARRQGKRTTIVIAHRLSTIRNADRIVVLGSKEGTGSAVRGSCLVEQGTHAELLEKEGGLYRALVAAGSGSEAAAPAAVAPTATAPTAAAAAAAAASSSSSSGGDLVLAVAADADDEDEDAATAGGKKKKKKKKKEVEEKEELYEVEKARIWAYSKPETPLIYAGTVAALFSGIVWPACGALMGLMIDYYYSPDVAQVRSKGEIMAWAFGGLALVNFCSQFCQNYLFEIVGERMARRLRAAYFRALLRQELAWHEQPENSVGTLGARLSTDVKLVRLVAGQSLAATVMSMTSLLAGFGIAFYASWRFTLAFIALFPLLAITEGINWALMQGTETAVRNELALISGVFSEYVSGIREVQSFALEPIVIRGVTETMQTKVLRLATKQAFSRGVSMFFVMFVQMNVYTIAFWMGGRLIADGHLNFQSFSVALWAMAMGASGMGTAAGWIGDAAKAKAATSRIFELLDRVPAIDVNPWCEATDPGDPAAVGPRPAATEAPAAIPEAAFHGAVELRGVRFAYPTRQTATVFDGLNLAIPAGQTAALVGSSGCGKSTVIQLLERFYDPAKAVVDAGSGGGVSDGGGGGSDGDDDNGSVCIDGVDIKTLDVKWLRDHVGLVGQEPVLFDASVADNIAFGKPDATRAEIEAAAKAANAHEFIEAMAQGYDTNVGARGGKVSGGQKQRIAIARAIIKRPRILLLDEATSALDNESEKIVQASLDALIADKDVRRTTIMIAHRLNTIRNADCIYVLENSGGGAVVVETGTHDELVAKNGKYAKLQQAYAQE